MMDNENAKQLNADELASAAGGSGLRDHPMYNAFKDYYKQKGVRQTLLLCTYHGLNGEDSYEMVRLIGEDIESEGSSGNSRS